MGDFRRLAFVVTVLFAGVSSADVVKELFPWFEIGETIDADTVREAKLRGRDDPAPREGVALRQVIDWLKKVEWIGEKVLV